MSGLKHRLAAFLSPPDSSSWLTVLRIGLGLQVLLYTTSLRADWLALFTRENEGVIRRDLTEAMLSAESPLIPRIGWLVDAGALVGLSESIALWIVCGLLMLAALFLCAGLFSRSASVVTWILYVCTAKTAEVWSYGVDNFTTIGLFYLTIAPLPDAWSLDARWRGKRLRNARLYGLHRRILQLHMCIIYFFGGITKCAGLGWWNGESLWRALTRAPFDVVPPEILIRGGFLLPVVGILACVMEATYPIFIWPLRTRPLTLALIIFMHIAIGGLMGMYLFASIMIILNVAAFGAGLRPLWEVVVSGGSKRASKSLFTRPPLIS